MKADISGDRIHQHVGDDFLSTFICPHNPLDINLVSAQCFLDPVFETQVSRMMLLVSVNESLRLITGTVQYEVNMVGHQGK